MKDRIKKIISISPLKITVLIILIALTFLLLDVPFLRFMELKALDLRILSRGKLPAGGEPTIAEIEERGLSGAFLCPAHSARSCGCDRLRHPAREKAVGFDI